MTPEQLESSFSAAYDGTLDVEAQREFDAALLADPQLAQRYAEFCRLLAHVKELGQQHDDADVDVPTPDLLGGIQKRLREKSAGRFYADRFSERAGWGAKRLLISTFLVALSLTLIWLVSTLLTSVHVTP
jgi:anti-sigma factor RsiW